MSEGEQAERVAGDDSPEGSARGPQFSLRTLLIATAAAAVLFALVRIFGLAFLLLASVGGTIVYVMWWNIKPRPPEVPKLNISGRLLSVVLGFFLCGVFAAFLMPSLGHSKAYSQRSLCQSNLRQIAIALHTYHDTYYSFPPAYLADENGKPMHSWRTLLLPFLQEPTLYGLYRWDEPWDGPNNRLLHDHIMRIYQCPCGDDLTNADYVVITGPEMVFYQDDPRSLAVMADGTSNTLLLVEVRDSPHHWMEPRDLEFDQMELRVNGMKNRTISSLHPGGANVVYGDVHVKTLPNHTKPYRLESSITPAGAEPDLAD